MYCSVFGVVHGPIEPLAAPCFVETTFVLFPRNLGLWGFRWIPLLYSLAISGEIRILVAISVVPGGSSVVSLMNSAQSCWAPVLSPGFMKQLLCFHQTGVAGAPLAPVLCSLETSGVIPIKLLPCSEDWFLLELIANYFFLFFNSFHFVLYWVRITAVYICIILLRSF